MYIDITDLVRNHEDMIEFSASRAEGYEGHETWQNAKDYFDDKEYFVYKDEDMEILDAWIADWGAWDEEERAEWTVLDYNALLLQFIAGDIRERQTYIDCDELEDYEENFGGRIYVSDGSAEYYIGN